MTEIALHGFDVITGADAVHGVSMAKVVYPCVGKADAFHDTLEAVGDRTVGDIASKLIGEHQAAVLPRRTCHQTMFGLLHFLCLQQLHHIRRGCDGAALVVFRWGEVIGPALSLTSAKLLIDENRTLFKIHAIPHQSEQLTFAQAGEEIDGERNFILAAFQEIQKLSGLLVGQRMDLFFDDFGQNTRGRRIVADVVEKDGLLERFVQHTVDVLDGFST